MSFKIASNEFQFAEARNDASVRTLVPVEAIEANGCELLMPRIRGAGFSAGDHIKVQVMGERYETLIAEADFVVVAATVERQRQVIDDRRERLATTTTFRLMRKGAWWYADGAPEAEQPAPLMPAATIRWNPGKKLHEAVDPEGNVLFADADKDKVMARFAGKAA